MKTLVIVTKLWLKKLNEIFFLKIWNLRTRMASSTLEDIMIIYENQSVQVYDDNDDDENNILSDQKFLNFT